MKLAVIDIGSNAVRLQISKVVTSLPTVQFKKVEYLRFPLRLGEDVFTKKRISIIHQKKLTKLLHAFKLLLELYEVDAFMINATSALREAINGASTVATIQEEVGLPIHIIDGVEEASLLQQAIAPLLPKGYCLHIEVGGGSTELSFYKKRKKLASQSFGIGSIRLLIAPHELESSWQAMGEWIKTQKKYITEEIEGIATGGNIRKLLSLAKKKDSQYLSFKRLQSLQEQLSAYKYEERQQVFNLNEDRADVILSASKIYLKVMQQAHLKKVLVPDVGLKDGMLNMLYNTLSEK